MLARELRSGAFAGEPDEFVLNRVHAPASAHR